MTLVLLLKRRARQATAFIITPESATVRAVKRYKPSEHAAKSYVSGSFKLTKRAVATVKQAVKSAAKATPKKQVKADLNKLARELEAIDQQATNQKLAAELENAILRALQQWEAKLAAWDALIAEINRQMDEEDVMLILMLED